MMVRNALALALGISVTLAGCATTATDDQFAQQTPGWEANAPAESKPAENDAAQGTASTETAPTKPVDPVVDYLDRARSAMEVSGGEETARQVYREAITAFPTDKRPWMGLAQSYFELSDFGNAILAAQEVVQRDPEDETAHGILAISGLRVATMALGSIRESGDINASARREAEIMSRNLRILFGAQEKAAEKETPAPRRAAAPVRNRPAPAVQPEQAARPAPAPRAQRPAPAPRPAPAAPSNPFGALR
jgi:hypothetical protein